MSHLARSGAKSTCANNQVFVQTISTVAGVDDGNFSLLQLVCGGFLDSSVSPAWQRVYHTRYNYHIRELLTIDSPILVNEAFTNIRKTDRAEDGEIHLVFCEMVVIKKETSSGSS